MPGVVQESTARRGTLAFDCLRACATNSVTKRSHLARVSWQLSGEWILMGITIVMPVVADQIAQDWGVLSIAFLQTVRK